MRQHGRLRRALSAGALAWRTPAVYRGLCVGGTLGALLEDGHWPAEELARLRAYLQREEAWLRRQDLRLGASALGLVRVLVEEAER